MRLIDADDMEYLEELEYEYHPESNGEPWYRAKDVWDCIEKEHTVDPASLRPKGEWIMKETLIRSPYAKNAYCSECLEETSYKHNFCPNCGADMRGDKHD